MQLHRPHLQLSRRFLVAGLFITAIVATTVLSNRFLVYDWVRLWHYKPSNAIASLATEDTMTSSARRIYYVNHPQLESKTGFAPNCPSGTEQTVVLGCYHSDQAGIYLLQVTDPDLQGIEQVTAAHETLHAAYDRLSGSERNKINSMLLNYYNHGLNDPIIQATIASYKQSEPHDVVNEMHSVFGTEASNLPPALEAYYTRYFTNRAAIVADYTHYEAALTSRVALIKGYDAQLASWKQLITADQTDLQNKQAQLHTEQKTLDAERSSGQVIAYNAGVTPYNTQIDAYNNEIQALQALYAQYNQLVTTRNQEALEQQQLVQAITTTLPASK